MQIVKYKLNGVEMVMTYTEKNLEIAKAEADNGEYTIVDDDQEEAAVTPTQEERISDLEEALDMILSGVTE